MKVKELVEKLAAYNQDAEVTVVAHCRSFEFDLCCGGGDGCEKNNCDTVDFYVDDLCTNEMAGFITNPYAD